MLADIFYIPEDHYGPLNAHLIWTALHLGELMTLPWGVACMEPKSTGGRLYEEDY